MHMIVEEEESLSPNKLVRQSETLGPRLITSRADLAPCKAGSREEPLLYCFSLRLVNYYEHLAPSFRYSTASNPRRVLTKPHKVAHNDGADNENWDLVCYVGDVLGKHEGGQYQILDLLGQGTFGQVFKCVNRKTRELVAVKVIKNKPAYYNQSLVEVAILDMLNNQYDPNDAFHIGRMKDTFVYRNHLCIAFELLSVNLYELVKQNQFRGLSTNLVRVFVEQILDALCVLSQAKIIHCDLKPENILLKNLESPSIKIIDFGSACHENQTVYTYIQSRFYRSPEVLLSLPYTSSIDMWSVGCIAAELFLGLPLFPGSSEYNQICRIVEMLGNPPAYMLDKGKSVAQFFVKKVDHTGGVIYRLKTIDEYSADSKSGRREQPSKRYFQGTTLHEIVSRYPLNKKNKTAADIERELLQRRAFLDFLGGLLHLNPLERWSPHQAKMHPFITGEAWNWTAYPTAGPYLLRPKRPHEFISNLTHSSAATNSRRASISAENLGGAIPTRRYPATHESNKLRSDYYRTGVSGASSAGVPLSLKDQQPNLQRSRAQSISSSSPIAAVPPQLAPLLVSTSQFAALGYPRAEDSPTHRLLSVPSAGSIRRGSLSGLQVSSALNRSSSSIHAPPLPIISRPVPADLSNGSHRSTNDDRSNGSSRAPSIAASADWEPLFDAEDINMAPNSPSVAVSSYGKHGSINSFWGSPKVGGSATSSASSLLMRNSGEFNASTSAGLLLSPSDTSSSFVMPSPRLVAQEYAAMNAHNSSQERLWTNGSQNSSSSDIPLGPYTPFSNVNYPPNNSRPMDPIAAACLNGESSRHLPLRLPPNVTANPQIMTFMGRRASAPNVFQFQYNRSSSSSHNPLAGELPPMQASELPLQVDRHGNQPFRDGGSQQNMPWYTLPPS